MSHVRMWTVYLTDTEMREALGLLKNRDRTTPEREAAADHLLGILQRQVDELQGAIDWDERSFRLQFPGRRFIRLGDEPGDVQLT